MRPFTDESLLRRGTETLLASWREYARDVRRASFQRLPGVTVAVFAEEPERAVFNNAVRALGLEGAALDGAITAMEAAYSTAGVDRYAVWAHETDAGQRAELEQRGYTFDSSTLAMGLDLHDVCLPRPELPAGGADWDEFLAVIEAPGGLLAGSDHRAFDVLVARDDGDGVAGGL